MQDIVDLLAYYPFAIAQGDFAIQQQHTTLAGFEVGLDESCGVKLSDPKF